MRSKKLPNCPKCQLVVVTHCGYCDWLACLHCEVIFGTGNYILYGDALKKAQRE